MKTNDAKQFNKLIKKIASKEKDALEIFYKFYGKFIYTSALSVTKSSFYADEVVNDVLVKIWRVSQRPLEIDNPRAWLYTLTTNCAKDKIKSVKQVEFALQRESDRETNEEVDKVLNEESFYYLISSLSEIERQIMIFRFVEDLSFKSISREMQMPLGTVTVYYYRALEKIRKDKLT